MGKEGKNEGGARRKLKNINLSREEGGKASSCDSRLLKRSLFFFGG